MQPTALPMVTPMRAGSSASGSRPLSATASRAQPTANCAARSRRRASSTDSPLAAGSKSTSAATLDRNGSGSNDVMVRVAVRPSTRRSQNGFVPQPPGATTPMPVIATRRSTSVLPTPFPFAVARSAACARALEDASNPARTGGR